MKSQVNEEIRMVLVDLDGTLLNDKKHIGDQDKRTLQDLGKEGILRVIATGRSLHSAFQVLNNSTPIDYLVFSSGAGILEWKSKSILFKSEIQKCDVLKIDAVLRKMNLNFSVHLPVPDNHRYFYFKGNQFESDFDYRNSIYHEFSEQMPDIYPFDSACQFLIILEDDMQIEQIVKSMNGFKTIRATSPINHHSIWLEIFNPNVSKALAGQYICRINGIFHENTLGIGNDYNDLDLLHWVKYPYLVANAPEPIKGLFAECCDNNQNPLTNVINQFSV